MILDIKAAFDAQTAWDRTGQKKIVPCLACHGTNKMEQRGTKTHLHETK